MLRLFLSTKRGLCEKLFVFFFASPCKFFLVLNQLFSLTQVIVLLKSWGGAVVGQSDEVALSCYKGGEGAAEMLVECGDRLMNQCILLFIASDEAYSTSQISAAVRQITSESPVHPGKHVATTLGCSSIFWNNIVNLNGTGEM